MQQQHQPQQQAAAAPPPASSSSASSKQQQQAVAPAPASSRSTMSMQQLHQPQQQAAAAPPPASSSSASSKEQQIQHTRRQRQLQQQQREADLGLWPRLLFFFFSFVSFLLLPVVLYLRLLRHLLSVFIFFPPVLSLLLVHLLPVSPCTHRTDRKIQPLILIKRNKHEKKLNSCKLHSCT